MIPIYYDVEQGSDEWLALRLGRITSSTIGDVMAGELTVNDYKHESLSHFPCYSKTLKSWEIIERDTGDVVDGDLKKEGLLDSLSDFVDDSQIVKSGGLFGETARKLAVQLGLQRVTNRPSHHHQTSFLMRRGTELEPIARAAYEQQTGIKVHNGGFFAIDENIGDSPDGLAGSDGIIEIKCVSAHVHYQRLHNGGYDDKYRHQIAMHLLATEREWVDFVSYCEFFPAGNRLYVYQCTRDEMSDAINKLRHRIGLFDALVEEIRDEIERGHYGF